MFTPEPYTESDLLQEWLNSFKLTQVKMSKISKFRQGMGHQPELEALCFDTNSGEIRIIHNTGYARYHHNGEIAPLEVRKHTHELYARWTAQTYKF